MKFKSGVFPLQLSTQMLLALQLVDDYFKNELGEECVVTSLCDSTHSEGSLHWTGNAADIRTKHIPGHVLDSIVEGVKACLPDGYDVVLEAASKPNEHLHIEWQPKLSQIRKHLGDS